MRWRGNAGHKAMLARGRLKAGAMNNTERAYGARLELLKASGAVYDYRFQAVKLRLADGTFYTPDFVVIALPDMVVEMHEVKGHWLDDARVKIKVAAELFPWFRFKAVRARARKHGGGWYFEDFGGDEEQRDQAQDTGADPVRGPAG